MTTRREIITSGLGLAGIIAAGRAPAAFVRSMVAARSAAFAKSGGGGGCGALKWIKALNGTSYIRTNFVPSDRIYGFEIDICYTYEFQSYLRSGNVIFGCASFEDETELGNDYDQFTLMPIPFDDREFWCSNGSNWWCWPRTLVIKQKSLIDSGLTHNLVMPVSQNSFPTRYYIDGSTRNNDGSSRWHTVPEFPITIFGWTNSNNNSIPSVEGMWWKRLRIFSDEKGDECDYIAYMKDGVIGAYDTISNEFVEGVGTFSYEEM